MAAKNELVITRVFDAPRELVFKAWTEPGRLVQWWGPNGFTVTIQEMDVRPGGEWNLILHGPDGTDYKNKSVFLEVTEPSLLVFAHESGPKFKSTVTFDEHEGKTKVTMRMLFDSAAEYDQTQKTFGMEEGAEQTFGRLALYLNSVVEYQ